jgi:acyl-CoA synthetase (AMP-forming)/AMP-acid ligase II
VTGGNEEVVAFVEADPQHPPSVQELRDFLAERLSPYKCPSEIVIMPALPAAATGKILKGRLKALAQDMPAKKD